MLLKQLAKQAATECYFEYSPESFHGAEVEYALEVCNAVLDVWQPTAQKKAVINIPATVETAMPHIFASQVEDVGEQIVITDKGFAKRVILAHLDVMARYRKGVKIIDLKGTN